MDSQVDPPPPTPPPPPPAAAAPLPTVLAAATATAEGPTPVANPTPPKRAPSSTHPPYAEMISSAISALNERDGSSKRAIAKYIEANLMSSSSLPHNHDGLLTHTLKKLKESGQLVMVKHSYKLSSSRSAPAPPSNGVAPPPSDSSSSIKRRPGRPRKEKNNPPETTLLQAAVPVFPPPPAPPLDINAAAPPPPPEVAVEQGGSVYVAIGPINGPSPTRGRGRPPKQVLASSPRGRGRPKKVVVAATTTTPAAVVQPAQVVNKGSGRPRGRPPKPVNVVEAGGVPPVAVTAPVAAGGGGVAPVVAAKRRGRPPKAATGAAAKRPKVQQTVAKPKTPRKLSGKPLGRPKKNATPAVSSVADTQLLVAYLDLKGKLESLQDRVKLAANVIKPYLTTEDAINAIQELELLATVNATAPPNVQSQS